MTAPDIREVPALTLDEAWAEAEAAVPEGWWLWFGRGAHGYTARANAATAPRTPKSLKAYGATPVEALQALTQKCAEAPR